MNLLASLKSEIAKKKKTLEAQVQEVEREKEGRRDAGQGDSVKEVSSPNKKRSAEPTQDQASKGPKKKLPKYVKRGDLEKLRQQAYWEEQEQIEKKRREKLETKLKDVRFTSNHTPILRLFNVNPFQLEEREARNAAKKASQVDSAASGANDSNAHSNNAEQGASNDAELGKLSTEEIIRRLRAKRQPIRLFAESDQNRLARLKHLEMMEEKSIGSVRMTIMLDELCNDVITILQGQQNDFMKTFTELDSGLDVQAIERKAVTETTSQDKDIDGEIIPDSIEVSYLYMCPCYPLNVLFQSIEPISQKLLDRNGEKCIKLIETFFKVRATRKH